MKPILVALLTLCSTTLNAQVTTATKKKTNPYSFNLIFTPQLFLHNLNLHNDGIAPETISTKNTGGFRIGAEIERRSRKNGFVMDLGITYGIEHQFINITYDNLVFYEPSSAEELLKLGSFNTNHTTNSRYLDIHFNAGYIFPVKILNGWQPVAKAGVFFRGYYQFYQKTPTIGINFFKNDTLHLDNVSLQTVRFGSPNKGQFRQTEMELYAGLTKNLHAGFLKNINIGIEVTRTLSNYTTGNSTGGYADVRSFSISNQGVYQPLVSADYYRAKDIAIGLKFSAGLWYK